MRYFFYIAILSGLFGCNSKSTYDQLKSCRELELTTFEHSELAISLKIPAKWDTEIDINLGDTLGATSIDTAYFKTEGKIVMFGWMQYSTTVNESINFEVIQHSFDEKHNVELLKKGKIRTGTNKLKYLLLYEDTWNDNPMTNLLTFQQVNNQVITCFNRIEGRTTDLNDFCLFAGILEQVGQKSM